MKWKGTVSQSGSRYIAIRFTMENATQAMSIHRSPPGQRDSLRVEAISHPPDRRDGVRPELGPQAPHVHVYDVGARIEVVAPDGREQTLLRDRRPRVAHQLAEQQELSISQRHRPGPSVGL